MKMEAKTEATTRLYLWSAPLVADRLLKRRLEELSFKIH